MGCTSENSHRARWPCLAATHKEGQLLHLCVKGAECWSQISGMDATNNDVYLGEDCCWSIRVSLWLSFT